PFAACFAAGDVLGGAARLLDQTDDPLASFGAVDRAAEIDRIAQDRDVVRAQLTGKCLGEFVPHLPQRAVAVGLEEGDDAAWVPLQRTKRGAAFLRVVAEVIDHGDARGAGADDVEAASEAGE